MTKTIVTHQNPDMDAIMSSWLLMKFDQSRYGDAKLVYISAGTTYKNRPVDSDKDVVHVDVGLGKFDHHQLKVNDTCATELVYRSLVEEGLIKPSDEAVKAMVEYAKAIDLFEDFGWQEASESRFAFTLAEIIPALHSLQIHDNEAVVRMIMMQLDGVYQRMKNIYRAKQAILEGKEFESSWGKGLMVKSGADSIHKIAQHMGYALVVVEDKKRGYLGVKTAPNVERSLNEVYVKISELDGENKWFYHNSGHMLLHGSKKSVKPDKSNLNAQQVVEIIQAIK